MKIEHRLTHYRKFFIRCEQELDDFWCFIQNEEMCLNEMAFIYHISSEILYEYLKSRELFSSTQERDILINIDFYKNLDEDVFFEIENFIFTSKVKRHIKNIKNLNLDIKIYGQKTLIRGDTSCNELSSILLDGLKDNHKKIKELPDDNNCHNCKFIDFDSDKIENLTTIQYPKIDAKLYLQNLNDNQEINLLIDELLEIVSNMKDELFKFDKYQDKNQLMLISRQISYFSMTIKNFIEFFSEFESFSTALDEMALNIATLQKREICTKKTALMLKAFIDDLEDWLVIIFKEKKAVDIHYLDDSMLISAKELLKLSKGV